MNLSVTKSDQLDTKQPFEIGSRVPCLLVLFPDEDKSAVFPYIHMLLPRQRQNEILIPFSVGEIRIRYNHRISDWVEEIVQALAECSLLKLRHDQETFSITVLIREREDLIPF